MDSSLAHKFFKRNRRDSGRLSPTRSRKSSQSTVRSTRSRQVSIPPPTGDPEPSTSLGSGASISQWRREEIHALPRELLGQSLLTMQARERQSPEAPDRPLISTPLEDMGGVAMTSEDPTVRSMFGSDIHASCFAERERVRQMDTLMVMWSRGRTH